MKKSVGIDKFLSDNDIIESALPYKSTSLRGIYFLINCGEIVYVGQSTNISQRVGQHCSSKVFDSYNFVEIGEEFDMDPIEACYIIKFQPKLNKVMPYKFGCISESYLNKTRSGGACVNASILRDLGIKPEFCLHTTRYFKPYILDYFEVKPYYADAVNSGEML